MAECKLIINKKLCLTGGADIEGDVDFTNANVSNLNHVDLLNIGTNTHTSIDTHIADETLHFTEASIDHDNISNNGTNTHINIDTHIADATLHFTEASIDHLNISNIGTNTHAQIDTHIADTSGNPHNILIGDLSLLTTKGDLATFSTVDTRLPIGSNTQILTADSSTLTGLKWVNTTSVGEINTISNIGTSGVGLFKQKTGVDFEFRNINAGSNKVSITLDGANDEVDIDILVSNVDHNGLLNLTVGDAHTQYAYLAGRSGGQTINGGNISGDNLNLTANTFGDGCVIISPKLNIGNISITGNTISSTDTNGNINIIPDTNGEVVINADPTTNLGVATKQYVDAVASNLDVKISVKAKTDTSLPSYTQSGIALTATSNASFPTLDTISITLGERVLIDTAGSSSDSDNGIYTLTQVGSGSLPWILTRSTDADSDSEVTSGLFTFVEEGNSFANNGYIVTTNDPITLDTTPIIFTQFTGAGQVTVSNIGTAGVGLFKQKVGNELQFKKINAGSNKVTITNDGGNNEVDIDIDSSNISHLNISDKGTNTHSQIDTHIADTSGNPHNILLGDLSALTTKGDLSTYSTVDTRLPVGGDNQILSADSSTSTGLKWIAPPGGEINTASNVGVGGIGVFEAKSGTNLQFRNIIAGSNKISVTLNSTDKEIEIDLIPGNISHTNLSNIGTNTHANIDSHINSILNPHSVTIDQLTPTTIKGDLLVEDGINVTKLPVGTDGQVLVADSATSTGLKWDAGGGGGGIFGSSYEDFEDLNVTVTSSTSWQNKINITTSSKPAGRYLILWSYAWNHDANDNDFVARIKIDGSTKMNHVQEPKDSGGSSFSGTGTDQRLRAAGQILCQFATSVSHTIKLQFSTTGEVNFDSSSDEEGPIGSSDESSIWDARIIIWRVA